MSVGEDGDDGFPAEGHEGADPLGGGGQAGFVAVGTYQRWPVADREHEAGLGVGECGAGGGDGREVAGLPGSGGVGGDGERVERSFADDDGGVRVQLGDAGPVDGRALVERDCLGGVEVLLVGGAGDVAPVGADDAAVLVADRDDDPAAEPVGELAVAPGAPPGVDDLVVAEPRCRRWVTSPSGW